MTIKILLASLFMVAVYLNILAKIESMIERRNLKNNLNNLKNDKRNT